MASMASTQPILPAQIIEPKGAISDADIFQTRGGIGKIRHSISKVRRGVALLPPGHQALPARIDVTLALSGLGVSAKRAQSAMRRRRLSNKSPRR